MKQVFSLLCAAAVVSVISGCAMCNMPIPGDQSCVEPSHLTDLTVTPAPISYTAPSIAPCTDVFRPTFRAGNQRITVTGVGESLDEATSDAIAKFLEKAECDYIVAVSRKVSMKTHPTWRFFATTNYTVTFSGMPIYLDKLVKVEKTVTIDGPKTASITPENLDKAVAKIIEAISRIKFPELPTNASTSPLGHLKLSDIDVQIHAKGATPENVGVAFPIPPVKK